MFSTKLSMWTGIGIFIGLVIWTAASLYVVWGIEEAKYKKIGQYNGLEIRQYPAMIVAETKMQSGLKRSENREFMILANFIFGDNRNRQKIAMTAPVSIGQTEFNSDQMDREKQSRNISMTAPVFIDTDDRLRARKMSFVMPSKFTAKTLPIPNDDRIIIKERPEKTMAVVRFSWYATQHRKEKMANALSKALKKEGFRAIGKPIYAGYNPPFSIPFLMRHEMMVEISPTALGNLSQTNAG